MTERGNQVQCSSITYFIRLLYDHMCKMKRERVNETDRQRKVETCVENPTVHSGNYEHQEPR